MSRRRRTLDLNPQERVSLEAIRDRDPKPYRRERAAALLLIAEGMSAHQVAERGVLKARKADTLYRWLNAYQKSGVSGLTRSPRACRRGFSP